MLALLNLIPLKDWLYVGAIVALLTAFGCYTVHERRIGAAHEVAAVQAASEKTKAEAQETIDRLDKEYGIALATIQEKQDEQLKAAATNADDLTRRLRNYQATHGSCPVLPSPAAPASGEAPAAGSVESAIEQLISAAEHDLAVINAERAERDLLTGK